MCHTPVVPKIVFGYKKTYSLRVTIYSTTITVFFLRGEGFKMVNVVVFEKFFLYKKNPFLTAIFKSTHVDTKFLIKLKF